MSYNVLSDEQIADIRNSFDEISWSIIDMESNKGSPNLRIDYKNKFLIESFNWFATDGLTNLFQNKIIVIPGFGSLKIVDHRLDRPRKDDIGMPNEPLWPNEARYSNLNYSGALLLKIEFTHEKAVDGNIKREILHDGGSPWIPFGKIPIMVGSAFCNLVTIETQGELYGIGESEKEYAGFFVANGVEKFLIAQNLLRSNTPICISKKITKSKTHIYKTMCYISSMGPDHRISAHQVFIANSASKKIENGDYRIYVGRPDELFKTNVYDSNETLVGINIISIFRMCVILIHRYHPAFLETNYVFMKVKGKRAGLNGESTYVQAKDLFNKLLSDHTGLKLLSKIEKYVNHTINEASLEMNEAEFWKKTIKCMDIKKEKSDELIAEECLRRFSEYFMPHCSNVASKIQLEDLKFLKSQIIFEVKKAANSIGIPNNADQISKTLELLKESYNPLDHLNISQDLRSRGFNSIPQVYHTAMQKYEVFKENIYSKLNMIVYMAVKVMRVDLGFDTYDNRDSLAVQKFDQAGVLMMSRFASLFRAFESKLNKIQGLTTTSLVTQIKKNGGDFITKELNTNMVSGKWNTKHADKERTGVTETMPVGIPIARLSSLRRISGKSNDNSTNTESRDISGLQTGAICIAETPEGKQVGNVEHLATAAFLTNESFDNNTLAYSLNKMKSIRRNDFYFKEMQEYNAARDDIKRRNEENLAQNRPLLNLPPTYAQKILTDILKGSKSDSLISDSRFGAKDTPLFMDGKFIGWVDGRSFRKILIKHRRDGRIHPHTGIAFKHRMSEIGAIRELKIETCSGRIVQPLLIAENPKMVVEMLMSIVERPITLYDLISEGHIEFVDSGELEFLDVAPSVDVYLKYYSKGLPERYDHIMLNPAFIFGFSGNVQPFANMNPVVRNAYFTAMVKQPITIPNASFKDRAPTNASRLLNGQNPLVKTRIYDSILEDAPFGVNMDVVFWPHKFGEEDGIVINREFLDNGGFSSVNYSTFSMIVEGDQKLEFDEAFFSKVEDPDRFGRGVIREVQKKIIQNSDGTYSVFDMPVKVNPHDILARKVKDSATDKISQDLIFDSLREGVVDRIIWKKTSNNSRILSVVIRIDDTPYIGDKLASRFSQKGIIAMVVDPSDMPYDFETGKVPDLIINPQALPSRMTIGMIAEMMTANAFIMPDRTKILHAAYISNRLEVIAPFERAYFVYDNKWEALHNAYSDIEVLSHDIFSEPIPRSEAYKRIPEDIEPGKILIVFSGDVFDQESLDWLEDNDLLKDPKGPYGKYNLKEGLYVIRCHGSKYQKSVKPKFITVFTQEISEDLIRELTTNVEYEIWIHQRPTLPALAKAYDHLKVNNSWSQRIIGHISLSTDHPREIVEELFFDMRKNPTYGIRVSNMPEDIRELYLKENEFAPISNQLIVDYQDDYDRGSNTGKTFFTRKILRSFLFDFIIPDDMRKLQIVTKSGIKTIELDKGMKYSDIEQSKEIVTVQVEEILKDSKGNAIVNNGITVTSSNNITMSMFEYWQRTYPSNLRIDPKYVINLPDKPKEIYKRRNKRIENLREATIFKGNMDINDAIKELQMMGYRGDGRRTFMNAKTGEMIKGGLFSGVSYYMPLKHKVKNKVQARGHGKVNNLLKPTRGRTKGGGLMFGLMDQIAAIKSGAASFVSERLLDHSGKTEVFVCKPCEQVCYREKAGSNAIICPMCKSETNPVKISIPYVFLHERNLLMGALVNFKIAVDEDED